jgi:asparagine N-glycosylation enzyme membrane subunit Stt3
MDIAEILLLIGITSLALWKKDETLTDIVFYIVSGVIAFYLGGSWMDDYRLVALMIVGLGLFQIILAVYMAFRAGGPAKGFSQFRGVWNSIRGVFKE